MSGISNQGLQLDKIKTNLSDPMGRSNSGVYHLLWHGSGDIQYDAQCTVHHVENFGIDFGRSQFLTHPPILPSHSIMGVPGLWQVIQPAKIEVHFLHFLLSESLRRQRTGLDPYLIGIDALLYFIRLTLCFIQAYAHSWERARTVTAAPGAKTHAGCKATAAAQGQRRGRRQRARMLRAVARGVKNELTHTRRSVREAAPGSGGVWRQKRAAHAPMSVRRAAVVKNGPTHARWSVRRAGPGGGGMGCRNRARASQILAGGAGWRRAVHRRRHVEGRRQRRVLEGGGAGASRGRRRRRASNTGALESGGAGRWRGRQRRASKVKPRSCERRVWAAAASAVKRTRAAVSATRFQSAAACGVESEPATSVQAIPGAGAGAGPRTACGALPGGRGIERCRQAVAVARAVVAAWGVARRSWRRRALPGVARRSPMSQDGGAGCWRRAGGAGRRCEASQDGGSAGRRGQCRQTSRM
ncbi:hypothetical protein GGX14DRAFT_665813 [Mycena pura]|uniref:Uncharacterized protein n=1 Tax=Mycena pura TaxID=153505 RepID=A0AAD6V1U3_9AGAR|nr:hypothetical protein GGX14DRAFT_665813 [Mycena pura]